MLRNARGGGGYMPKRYEALRGGGGVFTRALHNVNFFIFS